jgi:endonuclease/exonuclease/phosphatase family metal-dependent hydrolase
MIVLARVLACAGVLVLVSGPRAIAAPRTLKVVTHNIAGAYVFHGGLTAVDAAVRQARRWRPDVVMLEEVCEAQARAFGDRLPGYDYVFTIKRRHNKACRDHGPHFGEVLASRWPLSGVTRTNLRGAGLREEEDPVRYFRLTCALVAASDVPTGRLRACVAHLRAHRGPELDQARTVQVRRIHKTLHDDIAHRHVRVVVAGDFNARPQDPALDEMYSLKRGGGLGGAGDFFEGDQTDHRHFAPNGCGPRACRSGQFTCCGAADSLHRKYDYAFFSALGVSQLSGRALGLGGVRPRALPRVGAFRVLSASRVSRCRGARHVDTLWTANDGAASRRGGAAARSGEARARRWITPLLGCATVMESPPRGMRSMRRPQ